MVLRPGSENLAQKIFGKWELDFAIVGETTNTGRLIVRHIDKIEADMPVSTLANSAPEYQRPWVKTPQQPILLAKDVPAPADLNDTLLALMGSPDLCSRRWIWEQYDHTVMGDTIQRPGGDAALVRLHGTSKALAITTDVTPRYCLADPFEGGKQAVVETWRNITCSGASPLAITNCLNFGNPEREEIMGQFVGAIQGLKEACTILDFPVVSGNVSLYNETNGKAIPPTPAIGGVGLLEDLSIMMDPAFKAEDEYIIVLGREREHLGQSLFLKICHGRSDGAPPPVDLKQELETGNFVRKLIHDKMVSAVHDCSDGGLLVTIAEMALAGNIGAHVILPDHNSAHGILFGEDQGRYVITTSPKMSDLILAEAANADIYARQTGKTGGSQLTIHGKSPISLEELKNVHEGWLPSYMSD